MSQQVEWINDNLFNYILLIKNNKIIVASILFIYNELITKEIDCLIFEKSFILKTA
jgi:hypothetical protein